MLNSKNVLIVGGSKGIGREVTMKMASLDYNVYVIARTCDELLTSKIKKFISIDLEDFSISQLKEIENVKFDVLVNNSGGPPSKAYSEVNKRDFLNAFSGHLFSFHELVKFVTPNMKQNNYGKIVNIISVTANNPLENMIVSNSLRGAMINWSKTLSKELGFFGVTVNNVLPGYTETDRLIEVATSAANTSGVELESVLTNLKNQSPMKRFGNAEEVADAVVFLASENASYINGQSLSVDGGWTPCI